MHQPREIHIDKAANLYHKLRGKLAVIPSLGCYAPGRIKGSGNLKDWPLSHWKGAGHFPLIVKWSVKADEKERPTFQQFCLVYRLDCKAE